MKVTNQLIPSIVVAIPKLIAPSILASHPSADLDARRQRLGAISELVGKAGKLAFR